MRIAASALVLAALSAPALADFTYGEVWRHQALSVARLPTSTPESLTAGPWAHYEHLEYTDAAHQPGWPSYATASGQSDLGPGYMVGIGQSSGWKGDPGYGVGGAQETMAADFTITEPSPYLFAVDTSRTGLAFWIARLTGPSGPVFILDNFTDGFGPISRSGMLEPGSYHCYTTFGAGWDLPGVGGGSLEWSYRLEVPGPGPLALLGLVAIRRHRGT